MRAVGARALKPKMIIGDFTGKNEPRLQAAGWGRMKLDRNFIPTKGMHKGRCYFYEREPWALDNGAFVQWSKQGFSPAAKYDFSAFERRLAELEELTYRGKVEIPLFVVAPDLPAQGLASLNHSIEWIHERIWSDDDELYGLRTFYSYYLAVQDGMRPTDLLLECWCGEPVHSHFQGVFLGGTDRFKKEEALAWSATAKALGLKFHYGRCGTIAKLYHAQLVGADSMDSAFFMRNPPKWDAFEKAWLELDKTPFSKLHSEKVISQLEFPC